MNFDGAPVDPQWLARMAAAASHRGPDGIRYRTDGQVGFAHLALINTPESQREQQPVVSRQGDLILSADARLDNRNDLIRTLTARGHVKNPNLTDADLILAAYRCWHTNCPARLIGDFAFALWNRKEQSLFAARDAMGMRAFYYRVEPKRTLFATEVKQILTVPDVPVRVFEPAVGAHLAGPFGQPDWTFYEGIAQLPAAHALLVGPAGQRTWRYWDIDPDERLIYANEDDYTEHFLELFKEAVRCRLRSVKPVGISLSGGVDSGSAASTAGWILQRNESGNYPPFRAYCWAFDELSSGDERHISNGIVDYYGFPITNVSADTAWPLKDYPDYGPDQDDPFIWPYQPLIERTLAAAKSEGMGLMLTGDRGDEMVGGWIFDHLGLLRTGQWRALWDELQAHCQQNRISLSTGAKQLLVRPFLLNSWPHPIWKGLSCIRGPKKKDCSSRYPDWVRPEFAMRIGLDDVLHQNAYQPNITDLSRRQRYQRIFMFAGMRLAVLNERTRARFGLAYADPWSDRRIASFVLSVPQWVIQQTREPKRIARRAMRGIMPEAVRQTARKIEPHDLYDRGFMERARGTVQNLITDTQAAKYGYLDECALQSCYASYLRGEPQRDDFWWPITLEMWLRQYFPVTSGSP